MRTALALLVMIAFASQAAAQTRVAACPSTPATISNGQVLGDGWQAWIEGAEQARVESWTNGIAFFLPMVSGSPAATELQCVTRVPVGQGQMVTVEARKPLDGRYRCSFRDGTFNCRR